MYAVFSGTRHEILHRSPLYYQSEHLRSIHTETRRDAMQLAIFKIAIQIMTLSTIQNKTSFIARIRI